MSDKLLATYEVAHRWSSVAGGNVGRSHRWSSFDGRFNRNKIEISLRLSEDSTLVTRTLSEHETLLCVCDTSTQFSTFVTGFFLYEINVCLAGVGKVAPGNDDNNIANLDLTAFVRKPSNDWN